MNAETGDALLRAERMLASVVRTLDIDEHAVAAARRIERQSMLPGRSSMRN